MMVNVGSDEALDASDLLTQYYYARCSFEEKYEGGGCVGCQRCLLIDPCRECQVSTSFLIGYRVSSAVLLVVIVADGI